MEGLRRRQGIFDKLGTILKQDWGSLEEIKQQQVALQTRNERDVHQEEVMKLEKELQELQRRIVDAGEFPVLAGEEKESVN
jgi:DNA sulfur modification protein DndC